MLNDRVHTRIFLTGLDAQCYDKAEVASPLFLQAGLHLLDPPIEVLHRII